MHENDANFLFNPPDTFEEISFSHFSDQQRRIQGLLFIWVTVQKMRERWGVLSFFSSVAFFKESGTQNLRKPRLGKRIIVCVTAGVHFKSTLHALAQRWLINTHLDTCAHTHTRCVTWCSPWQLVLTSSILYWARMLTSFLQTVQAAVYRVCIP